MKLWKPRGYIRAWVRHGVKVVVEWRMIPGVAVSFGSGVDGLAGYWWLQGHLLVVAVNVTVERVP